MIHFSLYLKNNKPNYRVHKQKNTNILLHDTANCFSKLTLCYFSLMFSLILVAHLTTISYLLSAKVSIVMYTAFTKNN